MRRRSRFASGVAVLMCGVPGGDRLGRRRSSCPDSSMTLGAGPVLEAPEPFADEHLQAVEGDDGAVDQAAFDMCPHSLDGVGVE
ncbi:hypothetical protein GCM10009802_13130 [Streptomyces synnematoformans]|uniref:Secreted protein n=1 Tax=Streptomyces synnematoformans TaxID=415721 RepID=A0ABP5J9N9_9ACTN